MLTRNLTILASVIVLVSCFLLLMVSTITPGKNQAFARCPNGTHISPSGDCETVIPHAGLLRCPNGFHMSPSGNCEQVEPSTSGADSGNLNTVPSPTQNTSPSPPPSSSTSQFTGNFGTDVMPPETFITSVIDGSNSTLMGQGQVQQQTGPIGNNNTSSSLSSNPPSNTNTTSHSSKMMFTFAGTDNIAIAGFECSLDRPLQSPNSAPSALDAFASRVFSCSNRVVIDGLVPGTTHTFEVRAVDSSGIRDPSPARFEWRVENNSTTIVSPSQNISSLHNIARNITTSNSTIAGSQSTYTQQQPSNMVGRSQTSWFSTYKDPRYAFEIQIPSNWEVLPYNGLSPILGMEGIPVQVLSVRSPADQGIHDLLTISTEKQSRYLDTNDMKVKTTNMTAHDFANVFTQVLAKNGYKLVRENSTTISNLPGWRIECIMGGYEVQVFVVKKDGTAFTIKFNTPTLKAPESLPVFNKILGSFHFT